MPEQNPELIAARAAERVILQFMQAMPPLVAINGDPQMVIDLQITSPQQFATLATYLPLAYDSLKQDGRLARVDECVFWQWTGWQYPILSRDAHILAIGQLICQNVSV